MKNNPPYLINQKQYLQFVLTFLVYVLFVGTTFANNISVSNIRITGQNIQAGENNSANYTQIQFDISWENSWRKDIAGTVNGAPLNYDAAWVFIKYRVVGGVWQHATLSLTGNIVPTGSTFLPTADQKGAFIYRSSNGAGTNNFTGAELRWYYQLDGVTDDANVEVKVFAIEMVYVPKGSFYAGDGDNNSRQLNVYNSTAPYQITSESVPLNLGGSTAGNMRNSDNAGTGADDFNNSTVKTLPTVFPKGYNAFYCMKYELTQQAYVDFLNTLTYTQQVSRTVALPSKAVRTTALYNSDRNGIEIMSSGVSAETPAQYGCNYSNDAIFNDAGDAQNSACGYLSWPDLAAYLDWSGLRPMTELEFEKACRGNLYPVLGEYAWGSTFIASITGVSNSGFANEISTNAGRNCSYNFNIVGNGPLRVGVFATLSSTRESAGASYYGIMEMSGNLWETIVSLGEEAGRSFKGNHGDGNLNVNGDANVDYWPGINGNSVISTACGVYGNSIGVTESAGTGNRGGGYSSNKELLSISSRAYSTFTDNSSRDAGRGGRGIRLAP